jgi:GNAT superfamily N-acetyltransferase
MINIRFAERSDCETILSFITELAIYENMLDQVIATRDSLEQNIFDKGYARVIIAEYDNIPVGFALFFNNFSTFLGKQGIYLEDLYVKENMRGKGIGQKLISFLANIVIKEEGGRLEWACLDWNTPSLEFYKKQGASLMDQWTTLRVTGKNLEELAKKY